MRKKENAHLEDLLARAIALRRPRDHPVQTLVEFVDLLSMASRRPNAVPRSREKWDAEWLRTIGEDLRDVTQRRLPSAKR